MAKTNTEKIDELSAKLAEQIPVINYRLDELKNTLDELKHRIDKHDEADRELSNRVAALEERCKSLEKQSDRGWQLWLAALGFGLGLLSLLVTAALQLKK